MNESSGYSLASSSDEEEEEDTCIDVDNSSGDSSSSDEDAKNDSPSIDNIILKTKSDLSFEELLSLKEKIGSKSFNRNIVEEINESRREDNNAGFLHKSNIRGSFKRENRNRPQEMSSKKKKKYRNAISERVGTTRDPRFDDICGSKFNEEVFDKRYTFLNDIREREKKILRKKLKKSKSTENRTQIKYLLNRMSNQEREKARKQEERDVFMSWKQEEKAKVMKGKRPFFLKASERKKMIAEHRHKKLEESGKLEKVLEKRKKRLVSKQRRMLPQREFQ